MRGSLWRRRHNSAKNKSKEKKIAQRERRSTLWNRVCMKKRGRDKPAARKPGSSDGPGARTSIRLGDDFVGGLDGVGVDADGVFYAAGVATG